MSEIVERVDRLTSMIDRLSTQRACLSFAANSIAGVSGRVLEIGLGKGRTYDHLRYLLPDRNILAFDKLIHCPADVRPPDEQLWVGDFRETLAAVLGQYGACAALIHADIGSNNQDTDSLLASDIAPLIEKLMVPGGSGVERPSNGVVELRIPRVAR